MGDRVGGNDKAMWVRVVAVAGVVVWTAMTVTFGFGLVLTVLEAAGPKDTSQALVLERSAFEWQKTTCNAVVRARLPGQGCEDYTVPSSAVAGELADGSTWAVISQDAYDIAGPPGSELTVETSTITGRIVSLDNGRSYENRWNRTTSAASIAVSAMGAVLVLATVIIVPMLIKQRSSPGSLGRVAVLASVAGGIAVGSLGAWQLGFGGEASFEVPSSGDLYGDFVADPFAFTAQTGVAEEAGLVVESTGMRPATVRLVPRDQYGPAVIDQLANVGDRVPVFVILQSKYNPAAPFFAGLRATVDGEIVDATPCSPDWDDAEPIGVDTAIIAALMCFDRVPDSPEVYVPTNLTERGVAVAADFG